MKKYIIFVLMFYMIFNLIACGQPKDQVGTSDTINDAFSSVAENSLSSSENISSENRSETTDSGLPSSSDLLNQYGDAYYSRLNIDDAPVNLKDLRAVESVYIRLLRPEVFFYSWASAADIKADDLIEICAQYNLLDLPTDIEDVYLPEYVHAPAEQVEAAIQKHFNVISEYLKTSKWYEYGNVKNTYYLVVGGGGYWPKAISAEQDGNQIIIEAGMFALEDMSLTPCGTLTVELNDKNVVKYLSYQIDESFEQRHKNYEIANEN